MRCRTNLFPGRPAIARFILLQWAIVRSRRHLEPRRPRRRTTPPIPAPNIPFQVMRSDFPLKGEEAYDAISGINYQAPRRRRTRLAQDEARRIIAVITASTLR